MTQRADPWKSVDAFVDGQMGVVDAVVEANQRVDRQQ